MKGLPAGLPARGCGRARPGRAPPPRGSCSAVPHPPLPAPPPPQLLDLFMVWDWSTYLADYGQATSKYLRVNPSTALTLLEK